MKHRFENSPGGTANLAVLGGNLPPSCKTPMPRDLVRFLAELSGW